MIDLLDKQRNILQSSAAVMLRHQEHKCSLGSSFLAFRNWPLPHFCVVTLSHILLVSQSAVTGLVPQEVQGYGCSYSVYTSLSLMPHQVWGQCNLPWYSDLLPHISESSIYIGITHQCLRSRDLPSWVTNSEPAGSRQIPPSPVRSYALTAATLEKLWRRVIVHQNAGWHIAAVCTSF